MATVAERVARGAALLDDKDPGWWRDEGERAIRLGNLEMAEPEHCVLGQRCPVTVLAAFCHLSPGDEDELSALSAQWWRAYTAYAIELSGLDYDSEPSLDRWGRYHGFSGSIFDEYPGLTAEWIRVITGRRSA